MSDHRMAAPNYTNASLVMLGVNLTWVLAVIWISFGLIPALLLAIGVNRGITWLEDRRS